MNMRTSLYTSTILTIMICLLGADLLQAQTRTQSPYGNQVDRRDQPDFGIRAGVNFANVWDESSQEFEADGRLGFVGGVFMSLPIGPYFGIQPEALFSQKGYERDGSLLDQDYTFTRRASYIDIPIQLQVKPTPFLTILAGPQYSLLVHDDVDYDVEGIEGEVEEPPAGDIRDHLIGIGGGLDFNFERAVLSARVGWDLTSNEGDGELDLEEPRYKNQWIQVTLGVRF